MTHAEAKQILLRLAPQFPAHGIHWASVAEADGRADDGERYAIVVAELDPSLSLLDIGGAQQLFEEAFGYRVDLVPAESIRPMERQATSREAVRAG